MKNRRSSDPCASGGGRGYLARTPPIPSEISFRSQPTETCCDDNLIDLDLHKSESSDEALKNSDDAVVPKPGEDQPRASIVETENEELVALKAKCARLQSELEVERDRADNKEAAFALLARKYEENLNEKSRLQAKFLHLQTEKNQQSLHMRILTREIELLKRGCQHRPSFSSESPTIGNSRESVEELRSNSAIADHPASLERRRRMSVGVIERELAVLRGLDGERLDSSKSEPLPRSHSIHDMIRMRRLARQASNVSSSNISEVTNPRSSAYNARRDSSSLRDSLRSCDISRGGSDNKSTSHSFRNSRVSWHNSKDSLTVDLSHDDGCSHDARYLESQNTVNFGTSLEGDDSTDALPSVGKSQNKTSRTSTFQANSSRPGIEKMDSLRTLRASNTLTASMTMNENSFQPSVIDGSNDTSDRTLTASMTEYSFQPSQRSYDFSRSDSDNKSIPHSIRNSRVSWHNSKDSLTVDLSLDDGRSHDARYLESQNTVNFGTSLEGDDSTDALPSVGKSQNKTSRANTCQANSSRPGIDKMDSLRTLRASNTLTASMTMNENSFQPSVIDGSNDTSDRRGERFDEYNNNE